MIARVIERVSAALFQLSLLVELGPRAFASRRRALGRWRTAEGLTFPNGISTALTRNRSAGWYAIERPQLVVALYGIPSPSLGAWMARVADRMNAHFLVGEAAVPFTRSLPADAWTRTGVRGSAEFDLTEVLAYMHGRRRRWDLLLLDAAQPLPEIAEIVQMQFAAHEYHSDGEVGFVTPAYRVDDRVVAGYQFDRRLGEFVPSPSQAKDYGQNDIPRYVLSAPAHGFLATSFALDRVDVPARHLSGERLDNQVAELVRKGWLGNIRTLCFSPVVLDVREVPSVAVSADTRDWLMRRVVSEDGERVRIIFVLTATSISGGIRAVFQIANGLAQRGMDVEIWSLQGPPTWFELTVPVRTFDSYGDLLLSLRNADAIKVATWWETAEIVWLGSVNHGMPVYLIQEFETWFFPDDRPVQAAVVAGYRPEFIGITEASYQVGELEEIGMTATLVPHGYDDSVFHPLPAWDRESDSVLAVGRSFFQKNFAMTARAWRAMGERRPLLRMFGTEPDILQDDRVDYVVRPLDPQVNELYNTAAMFVQTSRHEGFCLPVLEAMAAGCPVITTDSHGNRDFCEDGVNCIVVGQDDDDALVAAIDRLRTDPAERDRLRLNGLATAARYRWPVVLDTVAEFYRRVAQAGSLGEAFDDSGVDQTAARRI
ncbi:MAG: glycosyltransferase family 4 protein [Microbacterium sp.]|uniref:glycosyltransferase family 4 protein n=1 Tax=Microbacterium sp. TaxID=51671 RepID=UPI0025FCAB81|nr:glycosyltransferase family 4 protein [Microbacterium sp.]MBQ9915972.1 glycosyltransferase family 4 protein [Microbacterium sp.]